MEWSDGYWLARGRISYAARSAHHSFSSAPINLTTMYSRATVVHRSNRHFGRHFGQAGFEHVRLRIAWPCATIGASRYQPTRFDPRAIAMSAGARSGPLQRCGKSGDS
jgi:hypothetical protein